MIRWSVFLLFILVVIFLACGGLKAPVVVVVDMERVAKESQQARFVINEVETFTKSVETQLNAFAGQIESAASNPKSDPARVDYMKAQFNEMVRQAEEQMDIRKNKAEEEVHKKLEETLKVLAKEEGWGLVIRKGPQSVLWADSALDRTSLVIQRMDISSNTTALPGRGQKEK